MDISEYEAKFIKGVNQTYEMLKELDDVTNDDDFWKMFGNINTGFAEIENARRGYYTILGGDTENCSLTHELNNGLYCLDEKYLAILEHISEVEKWICKGHDGR
jgi:hypothetical protein